MCMQQVFGCTTTIEVEAGPRNKQEQANQPKECPGLASFTLVKHLTIAVRLESEYGGEFGKTFS